MMDFFELGWAIAKSLILGVILFIVAVSTAVLLWHAAVSIIGAMT